MKKCSKCRLEKPLEDFPKNIQMKSGYSNNCKECAKIYTRTKIRVISSIYSDQKQNSIRRRHKPPTYSKEELLNWCLNQTIFHTLYDQWVSSDYKKELRPSLDRLEDSEGYSFDNIKIVTWLENRTKPRSWENNRPTWLVRDSDIKKFDFRAFTSDHNMTVDSLALILDYSEAGIIKMLDRGTIKISNIKKIEQTLNLLLDKYYKKGEHNGCKEN